MSDIAHILEAIHTLDQLQLTRDLTEEELAYLFAMAKDANPKIATAAAHVLTDQKNDVIKRVVAQFNGYSKATKKVFIPFLAACDVVDVYTLFFSLLQESKDTDLKDLTMHALAKTDYFIFPIILTKLGTDNQDFYERLVFILRRRGFRKIEAYLAMLPHIPYESRFREIFGNELIDKLKT